jgi:hypothetical protein
VRALKQRVAVSSVAVWTPGGVWLNAPPDAGPAGGTLAPWPEAPALAVVHPRARRPHREATVLVQLAHALLSARASADATPPPHSPAQTDLLLGTAKASEAADMDFLRDLRERGSGFGSPSTFVYTLSTAAPAEVAIALGLRGSLATLTAGSISGLSAVARAARRVSRGESRACITGGVELVEPGSPLRAGASAGEVAALFLLEPSPRPTRWPSLGDVELGFEPAPSADTTADSLSATQTLLALASACARQRRKSSVEIAGRSQEGHWARLRVRW